MEISQIVLWTVVCALVIFSVYLFFRMPDQIQRPDTFGTMTVDLAFGRHIDLDVSPPDHIDGIDMSDGRLALMARQDTDQNGVYVLKQKRWQPVATMPLTLISSIADDRLFLLRHQGDGHHKVTTLEHSLLHPPAYKDAALEFHNGRVYWRDLDLAPEVRPAEIADKSLEALVPLEAS